ncbi:MAG: aminopeptidase P N-terminal domain-containing protein [Deltaproteobacteria bacterium]|nr:aminopeptidase P N-terminal domain-containing protein [Deltaproteobacteria bacterium]
MEVFRERRRRLLDLIDGVAIFHAPAASLRNCDVEHPFRQSSDLYYLTGFEEPESVLVVTSVHPEHRAVMFVRPRDQEREPWEGPRPTPDAVKEQLGLDAAFGLDDLGAKLGDYLAGAGRLHYELGLDRAFDERVIAAVRRLRGRRHRSSRPWPCCIVHPEATLHELRLVKGEAEIASLRRAAAIAAAAHLAAMRHAAPGRHEYEVEAALREVFLRRGAARVAFEPIVASGPNATLLHYTGNRRRIEAGDLVLVDAGGELDFYASDVTRTFPASGRFSGPQRRIYEVVLEAELAAIAVVRPGATVDQVHDSALGTMVRGLVRLGLLQGDPAELIAQESHKRYCPHRTSHWLGMDVHDAGSYFEGGQSRALVPSMALTVEPGIYVSPADDLAPAEYRGIGVRIEDDVLVTASGHENLTQAIPKGVAEIEQACRR